MDTIYRVCHLVEDSISWTRFTEFTTLLRIVYLDTIYRVCHLVEDSISWTRFTEFAIFFRTVADLCVTELRMQQICPIALSGKQSLLQKLVVSLICCQSDTKFFNKYESLCQQITSFWTYCNIPNHSFMHQHTGCVYLAVSLTVSRTPRSLYVMNPDM
jgi:hypothetical protein